MERIEWRVSIRSLIERREPFIDDVLEPLSMRRLVAQPRENT